MIQLIGILVFVLVIGFLIITHEFGHFLMARLFKVDVLEFAVGMGPKVFSKVKNGTEYSLRAVPLGGFCAMYGSENEKVKDLPEGVTYSKEGAYKNKPVWQRMLIIVAGAFMNLLTCLICSFLLIALLPTTTTLNIQDVVIDSPAYVAGIQPGDTIVKYNNANTYVYEDFCFEHNFNSDNEIVLTLERDGQTYTANIIPEQTEKGRIIGVNFEKITDKNAGQIVKYGLGTFRYNMVSVLKSFGLLLTGKVPTSNITSIVGVAEQVNDAIVETDNYAAAFGLGYRVYCVFMNAINITTLLAANLCILNMFPIPALDGGHFLLLCVEAIRKKKISDKFELRWNGIGMIALYTLIALMMIKDILA